MLSIVLNISTILSTANRKAKPSTICVGVSPRPLRTRAIVIIPPPGIPAHVLDATIASTAICIICKGSTVIPYACVKNNTAIT